MEVSAIGPVSARQIDWRRLTAKEILEYNEQGVQVPEQYLQWAKEFQKDLSANDQDETTYEMAQAAGATQGATPGNNMVTENPQESENPKELSAQEKKEQMQKDGKNSFEIANEFRKESFERGSESIKAVDSLEDLSKKSDDAISELDGFMSDLMGEIGALKDKIETESQSGNKNNSSEINRLKRELENCGYTGQNAVNEYSTDLKQYQVEMDTLGNVASGAIDYGNLAIDIGKNLKGSPVNYVVGLITQYAGKFAVSQGGEAISAYQDALDINSANLSDIVDYQRDIKADTGVSASEASSNQEDENASQQQQAERGGMSFDTVVQAKVKQNENSSA